MNLLGGFQKNEYFGGMKILWIFLGGGHKIGVISMHFRVKVQYGGCFWGVVKVSNIFWGA